MNKKLLSKFVLLISIFILSFATVGSPLHTYASESTTEIPNSPVKIIESSDTMLIYEIEEDGEILRYEEDIKSNKNKTKIETKVYKEENGKLKLIDNFKTEINPTNHTDSFSVTQDGTTVIATKDNSNYDIQHQQVGMSTRAYSPWQKSSFPKLKLGYRKDFSSKKGQASYSTILRSNLSLSDKNFNEFVKRIDSLKTWEKAIIFDATVIGLIESGIKIFKTKKITLATLLDLGKKFFVPIATIYNIFNWFLDYDKATKLFPNLGGTKTTVCNWWC